MAITYLTGIPRSGKSYYAVYKLFHYFVEKKPKRALFVGFFYKLLKKYLKKENRRAFIFALYNLFGKKEKNYYCAYTNINEFDFSKTSRIKPFDYESFYAHLEMLHAMHLAKKSDSELLEYAKEHELYNIIIVIDECQNYFAKENTVLIWWFSYHGHLHQDIFLITQNLGLVYKEYFKVAEFYYRAIPPSNRLWAHKFRYMQFNSHNLYKTDRIGAFNVPMVKDVFDMYVSGAANNSKSIVVRFFMFATLLFIILIFLLSYFFSTFSPEQKASEKPLSVEQNETMSKEPLPPLKPDSKTPKAPKKEEIKEKKFDDNGKEIKDKLFEIRCFDMLCSYQGVDFPKPLLNKLMAKIEPEFMWFFNNGSYVQYFLMLPADTFDFLQKPETKSKKEKQNDGANLSKDSQKSSSHMPVAVPTSK